MKLFSTEYIKMTRIRNSKLKNGKIYYWKFLLLFLLLSFLYCFFCLFYSRWEFIYFNHCWWHISHYGIKEPDILDYFFINPLILSLVLSLILGGIITIIICLSIKSLKFIDWIIIKIKAYLNHKYI